MKVIKGYGTPWDEDEDESPYIILGIVLFIVPTIIAALIAVISGRICS